jgi:hypothetical protein
LGRYGLIIRNRDRLSRRVTESHRRIIEPRKKVIDHHKRGTGLHKVDTGLRKVGTDLNKTITDIEEVDTEDVVDTTDTREGISRVTDQMAQEISRDKDNTGKET